MLLEEALKDQDFYAPHLGDGEPEQHIIFEDKELGFVVRAHVFQTARLAKPHDHGHSWAIYGQAIGETVMSDWTLVEPATDGKPGKVRLARTYILKPGMAHLYNEGDLHSPRIEPPNRLIRVEGVNLDTIRRVPYVAV